MASVEMLAGLQDILDAIISKVKDTSETVETAREVLIGSGVEETSGYYTEMMGLFEAVEQSFADVDGVISEAVQKTSEAIGRMME